MNVPVFITCRDRLSSLLGLLDYLERAGCADVYLLDNASTYPPLLELYETTPHHVVRIGVNLGHQALWRCGVLEREKVDGPFVLSDSDIVPVEDCPPDAIQHFGEVLERHPEFVKVGFGLKIDDIPDRNRFKEQVVAWESRFWRDEVAPGLYRAPIGTTFALYPAGAGFDRAPAIRTGPPYIARHMTWYVDTDEEAGEQRFYEERLPPDATRWDTKSLPPRVAAWLEEQRKP